MAKNGLILMTALPPTLGHKYLIEFAQSYLDNIQGVTPSSLHVIVCSRDGIEPILGEHRTAAIGGLDAVFSNCFTLIHCFNDDKAPQNPEDHKNFWAWWKKKINKIICNKQIDIVFASDLYGKELAKTMGAEFVPCNTYREIIDISATKIRNDPIKYFDNILPAFQPFLKKTITFFGAESTGKTTISKLMAKNFNGYWVPEWAREYMEIFNLRIVDNDLMEHIMYAQSASQSVVQSMKNKPFVFQDTDLLSSIGYYKIANLKVPNFAEDLFLQNQSDLYILMTDKIPFTADPLRLGGHVRESNDQFWINLLEKYNCNYYVVKSTYKEDQEDEVSEVVENCFMSHPLYTFKRT